MPLPPDQPQQAVPPQYYPTHLHPEFGYLVPNLPFRRKASLVCKSVAFGAVVGAIAMIAIAPGREPAAVVPVLLTHAEPASVELPSPVVIPATMPSPAVAEVAAESATPAAVPPPRRQNAPPPRQKKKQVARQQKPDTRGSAPDSRSAFANFGFNSRAPRREWIPTNGAETSGWRW